MIARSSERECFNYKLLLFSLKTISTTRVQREMSMSDYVTSPRVSLRGLSLTEFII